ncbi:MAG: DUF5680 domain-containing protein [Candidatus Omnitrophota bacterium]|nr:DUF5680 domain-containing protein [Candidatus Omnitrophota bacterium]
MKAKQNTYASNGEEAEIILADTAKELVFKDKCLEYRDRYFGADSFIGQEIVFYDGNAIWGMNYYGLLTSDIIPSKRVYSFLQKALKKVTASQPFRGPSDFADEEFQYINKPRGTVDFFKGFEKILYKRKQIYQLHYHGGLIRR